jgi:hypothetical protein
MTSELTGIEGVQLGIFLYHFLHSHLGKTKYIGNVVSGHPCCYSSCVSAAAQGKGGT